MLTSLALPVTDTAKIFDLEWSSDALLAVGGDIRCLPSGSTRLLRHEDLLRLPQQAYTVSDDSHLALKTEISGVCLETLVRVAGELGADTALTTSFKAFDRVGSKE
jgi:hypothetical protein